MFAVAITLLIFIKDLKLPILFLLCVFWTDFKAISEVVSFMYMQSSGRFEVPETLCVKGSNSTL